jgi:uroporphyrinogen-III synthase
MIESTFSGKRIVVTRPRAQAKELQRAIEERGAKCVVIPLIEISQPDDEGFAFEQAMRNVSEYEWVICTSANGASRVAPYLSSGATSPKLAAVGDATALAFARVVDFTPSSANGKSLAKELPMSSGKVLVVQAQETSGEVVRLLRDRNMRVDDVAAYKTEHCLLTDVQVGEIRSADVVLVASGSAVRSWCAQAGPQVNGKVVAIGEPTQRVAADCGMTINAVAREASTAGVVAALAGVFA